MVIFVFDRDSFSSVSINVEIYSCCSIDVAGFELGEIVENKNQKV